MKPSENQPDDPDACGRISEVRAGFRGNLRHL